MKEPATTICLEEDASLNRDLSERLRPLFDNEKVSVQSGGAGLQMAHYRETNSSIWDAKIKLADCVEMEASALYAFSKAKRKPVVCFAHLANSMAQQNGDFEKGAENGSLTSLELISQTAKLLMPNEN
jgi:purine-nucleoside phosphorylase